MTTIEKRNALRFAVFALCVAGVLAAPVRVRAQTVPNNTQAADKTAASSRLYEFDISAAKQWTDTNLVVREGAKLRFTATGKVTYPTEQSFAGKSRTSGTFGPAGLQRGWSDMIHQYAVRDAGHGALIGRVGSAEYASPFVIGESFEYSAPVSGKLSLGINQSASDASTAEGSFHVTVEILGEGTAAAATTGAVAESRLAEITPDLLAGIPRRVSDPNNNPGDMVNVLIVGTEDQLVQAFTRAGWVQVDKTVKNTMLFAMAATLQKKDYVTMPMSTLFLFDRSQDFGFAHAEPVKVAMSRHHLRVWKSPYMVNGRPLWCISATHDIGFERDQRNNGVTHKIDPEVDGEREYVNGTLSETGLVAQREHVVPVDPLTTAKTATGGEFHSDGRIVVLVLKNTTNNKSE
jgi:hypothetical protein